MYTASVHLALIAHCSLGWLCASPENRPKIKYYLQTLLLCRKFEDNKKIIALQTMSIFLAYPVFGISVYVYFVRYMCKQLYYNKTIVLR